MRFLPGFRFRPTDEHILEHYLPRWSAGETLDPSLVDLIREVQFYGENEPDKIYEDLGIPSELRDGELYFFTLVRKKFGDTSCKDNKYMERVAGRGAWRGQNSRQVFNASNNEFIGYKTTLNFQINKRNLNPSWIMHEYIMPNHQHHDRFWAFCKVKRGTTGCQNKNKTPLLVESSTADADLCYPNSKKPRYSADSQERIHPQLFFPPRNLVCSSEASTSYASPVPTTSDILQGVQVTAPGAYEYPTPTCLTHHQQHPLQPCTQITDQEASQPATQSPPTLPPSAETLPRVTEQPCSPDFFDGLPNLDNIPIPDDLLDYHGWSQIIVEEDLAGFMEDFAMDFDLADSGEFLVT